MALTAIETANILALAAHKPKAAHKPTVRGTFLAADPRFAALDEATVEFRRNPSGKTHAALVAATEAIVVAAQTRYSN